MCLTCFKRNRDSSATTKKLYNCMDDDIDWEVMDDTDYFNINYTIDYSEVSFINNLWLVVPASKIIIKTSAFLPVMLWGIFGNVLLLYIIIKNRHLQSPTNMLIGNMAASDLVTVIIHPVVLLTYDFFQNYQLGALGCKVEGALECAVLLVSVINLVAISYDRLNAIVLPQENRLSRTGAKIIMVMAWIGGFALAAPLVIFRTYKERQWMDFLEKYCTEDMIVTNIYWHVIITMIVWLPLGTMLVCYIALFVKLNEYEQVVLRRIKSRNVSYKKKVAKMMFIVVMTFMICRLPFTALIFYRNQLLKDNYMSQIQQVQNQVNGVYYGLWFGSRYLIVLNAAINPVIYGLTSEKFRKALKMTRLSKWMFAFNVVQNSEVKVKNKQKQINSATTTNRIKIFFIFRGKFNRNKTAQANETIVTDCCSDSPIVNKFVEIT